MGGRGAATPGRVVGAVVAAASSALVALGLYRQAQARWRRAAQRALEASFRVGPAWERVAVGPSRVAGGGDGLFALAAFKTGEVLGSYRGRVLTLAQATKLPDRDYLMGGFGLNAHVDAREAYAMPGRYVNDHFDASRLNAEFRKNKAARSAALVAIRPIATGDEIHAAYGASYWRARGVDPQSGRSLAPPAPLHRAAAALRALLLAEDPR